ncbi:MAG: hypothetical protein HND53_04465 [Proteobacteria bacterium]|nr:hypothetical protein [Pseudomonadota bacterium]NOG59731.1 hypothetical protein [Pseudomonadota bacterium]
MKRFMKQIGQGMTEYIIIVALIAIAAIAVYTVFGDVIREQTGAMTAELAGGDGSTIGSDGAARQTEAQAAGGAATLDTFADK